MKSNIGVLTSPCRGVCDLVDEAKPRDWNEMLTRHACDVGLIRQGDKPDKMMVDFWMAAIDAAAAIADRYSNPESPEDTVGDIIRAHLYEG